MRAFDNGCFFSVQCSQDDVQAFKDQFPCSGIPTRPIWFQFQKNNGDLVDIQPDSSSFDGYALVCLADDAKRYGIKKLRLG